MQSITTSSILACICCCFILASPFIPPTPPGCSEDVGHWYGSRSIMMRASASSSAITRHVERHSKRRLIVDTDLGMDDLVALAILRVHQSMQGHDHQYTPFHLGGVTITPGVSSANGRNAALLQRMLPPNTPVYVSGNNGMDSSLSWLNQDKPKWWARTSDDVSSFLSSLPPTSPTQQSDMSAEQFIANNMDDPNVDFLCLAPLSTFAKALHVRRKRYPASSTPKSAFHVMGGIRSDSKVTKRGETTAPFGYGSSAIDKEDQFGEFNFALDIGAARTVLKEIPARIIPLEACTLVPDSLRPANAASDHLSSILKDHRASGGDAVASPGTDDARELHTARSILLKLFNDYGTTETQWDSISAAIYCNAFGSACTGGADCAGSSGRLTQIDSGELTLSDLGALSLPGCEFDRVSNSHENSNRSHWMYPTFTLEDEHKFFQYISYLLYSDDEYHS